MLIIVHESGNKVIRTLLDEKDISSEFSNLTDEFWYLSKKYPDHLLIWVEAKYLKNLDYEGLWEIFKQDHIMASYAIEMQYFSPKIGYVDQLPFVKPDYAVSYPTWRMSIDVGGIYGCMALKFEELFLEIKDFGYLLNSIAKIGQQNSLFCYSNPGFLKTGQNTKLRLSQARNVDLFRFTYQFYKTEWLFVLFFCLIKYEKQFPVFSFFRAFFSQKLWNQNVDLNFKSIKSESSKDAKSNLNAVDVIIPTLNRPKYLQQVLVDLKNQTLKPEKVIIVEQNPSVESNSELTEMIGHDWPFAIKHKFVHKTGACMARNLALKEVTSKWIFFADDDLRLQHKLLHTAISEVERLNLKALNFNCIQQGDEPVFHKIKQWGTFASGSSLVSSKEAKACRYRLEFEHGFGEDTDYGLQLRSKGVDIIYHPEIQVNHLKAPSGGFRQSESLPWDSEDIKPKPSPTMMLLVKYHFDKYMTRGYKVTLFSKYYQRQEIKNPLTYLKIMRKRWKLSEKLAVKMMHSKNRTVDEV